MFGKNEKRPPEKQNGDWLYVKEIFHTIQGEAIFSGRAAIFIRLGGCNLACSFCDTEFEDFVKINTQEIIENVKKIKSDFPNTSLVVITGGEPLRQNIVTLCQNLIDIKFTVQIETNGTLFLENLPKEVYIICSPKVVNGKYLKPHELLLPKISAFKFIISTKTKGYDVIPDWRKEKTSYVQPMDELNEEVNKENINLTTKIALNNDVILSLQTHKIINIP